MANQINTFIRSYKTEFITDEYDHEAKGKPRITWTNPLFKKDGSTDSFLASLAAEGVRAEFMICSGNGSILTDEIIPNTNLIYKDVLAPSGIFIDRSIKADETIIYYLLVLIKYSATRKNDDGSYRSVNCEVEGVLDTRRLTASHYQPVEKVVDADIAEKTAILKKKNFDQKFEKMMQQVTGETKDPEHAFQNILGEIGTRVKRRKFVETKVKEIEEMARTEGMDDEEIEEILEEFLDRIEE